MVERNRPSSPQDWEPLAAGWSEGKTLVVATKTDLCVVTKPMNRGGYSITYIPNQILERVGFVRKGVSDGDEETCEVGDRPDLGPLGDGDTGDTIAAT